MPELPPKNMSKLIPILKIDSQRILANFHITVIIKTDKYPPVGFSAGPRSTTIMDILPSTSVRDLKARGSRPPYLTSH